MPTTPIRCPFCSEPLVRPTAPACARCEARTQRGMPAKLAQALAAANTLARPRAVLERDGFAWRLWLVDLDEPLTLAQVMRLTRRARTTIEDALRAGQFPAARHTYPAGQRGRGRWLIPFGDALNWRNRRSAR